MEVSAMTYSANTVAGWIIFLAGQKGFALTHMQLQKCLYYAQGYSLGMTGEKLFDEAIMAWPHGPVVPVVYHSYKRYGCGIIAPDGSAPIPGDMLGLVDVIVSQKARLSASALRNATHNEKPYASTQLNQEISIEKLEEYFSDMFWTSDEEDEFEPAFDSDEEEMLFFSKSIPDDKKRAMLDACSL
jgi:uncharacterized phage-associated protein